jgi:DNA (cytosine-5)-methyltransferase 1
MQAHRTTASEFSSLPTPKARDSQPEGYEAGLRRATPQVGTIVKGLVDGDPRVGELLRTPAASEAERGHQPETKSRARGGQVTLSGQFMELFPTPNTMDMLPARTAEQKEKNKGKGGYSNVRETVVNDLMPTPKALDGIKGSLKTSAEREADGRQVDLPNVARDLLPTTRTSMKNGATAKEVAAGNPKFRLEAVTNWGKFEPAIRRWEEVLGQPAPLPTKPDGKDGAHRLSSAFTEWMMGLPAGWITDVGLSRNDELKACGNGVVPQQAALALRVLLEGVNLEAGQGRVTPDPQNQ